MPEIYDIHKNLLLNIENAKKSFIAIMPYYYPIAPVERAILAALDRKVDITIITA